MHNLPLATGGNMARRISLTFFCLGLVLLPAHGTTQISFPKAEYYLAMGDSVAAGQGALPMTHGYAYQLYDRGVFGNKPEMLFVNVAIRGRPELGSARSPGTPGALLDQAARPTIVTVTAGANDFLTGDTDIFAIAQRVAEAVDLLLHNGSGLVSSPALDPFLGTPCPALSNVTILVSNYYRLPHPVPAVAAQLDAALQGFDQALRFWLGLITVPAGSNVAVVDLYSASEGRTGLTLLERRLGFSGPFDFDIHPTNLGHTFIAQEFQAVWESLQ
jgi:hypothetical protein